MKKGTQQPDTTVILAALSDYKVHRTEKGYVADCPACEQEGENKGAGKLLVSEDGLITCMRFAGHDAEMRRNHRKDIFAALGVNENANFRDYALDDSTTLRVSMTTSRNRHQIALVQDGQIVNVDSVRIDKEAERKKFVKSLEVLTPKQSEEVVTLLTNLAGRSIESGIEEERETEYTGFGVLPDGRIFEMTKSGFAVYDSATGETNTHQVIEVGGKTYLPPRDKIFYKEFDEGIQLPLDVIEYGDDYNLMREIEAYISRYVDLPPLEKKLAAGYIQFTYIADRVYELPYFRIIGATGTQSRGSGKSRLANVVGRACYRPYKVTDPSAASMYRVMDAFHPTLVIDEFNFSAGSDDAAQMIMILNTGMTRGSSITRVERDEQTGEMVVNGFSPFGPKVVAGLALSESNAFESRAIRVEMQKTARKDIQKRTSIAQLNDGARMRGMLTLWRLRNYSMDIEAALDKAEAELDEYAIEPRFVQIATPLYALMKDSRLKEELAEMLMERTQDDAQERKLSPEGTIASVIHSFLFDVNDGVVSWVDKSLCVEGEPSDLLTIAAITAQYNRIFSDEKLVSSVAIGKKMSKMGLKSRTIEMHGSPQYKKTAAVFNLSKLAYQFAQYGLPLPEGTVVKAEEHKRRDEILYTKTAEKTREELIEDDRKRRPEVVAAWDAIEQGDFENDNAPALKLSKVKKTTVKKTDSVAEQRNDEKPLGNKPLRTKHLRVLPKGAKNLRSTSGQTKKHKTLRVKKVRPLDIVERRVDEPEIEQSSSRDTTRKFRRGMFNDENTK